MTNTVYDGRSGVSTMQGCCAPCLVNLSTSSFPMMFMWALTLSMVRLWWGVFNVFTTRVKGSLSRWSYWEDEYLM